VTDVIDGGRGGPRQDAGLEWRAAGWLRGPEPDSAQRPGLEFRFEIHI
jgi:hypothetical protein